MKIKIELTPESWGVVTASVKHGANAIGGPFEIVRKQIEEQLEVAFKESEQKKKLEYMKCECGGDIRYAYTDTIEVVGFIDASGEEVEEELGCRGEGGGATFDSGYRYFCNDCGKEFDELEEVNK